MQHLNSAERRRAEYERNVEPAPRVDLDEGELARRRADERHALAAAATRAAGARGGAGDKAEVEGVDTMNRESMDRLLRAMERRSALACKAPVEAKCRQEKETPDAASCAGCNFLVLLATGAAAVVRPALALGPAGNGKPVVEWLPAGQAVMHPDPLAARYAGSSPRVGGDSKPVFVAEEAGTFGVPPGPLALNGGTGSLPVQPSRPVSVGGLVRCYADLLADLAPRLRDEPDRRWLLDQAEELHEFADGLRPEEGGRP